MPEREPELQPLPRFELGQVVLTSGAIEALAAAGLEPVTLLKRHVVGDWGDLDEEDKKENEFSVDKHLRLMSSYVLDTGEKIWIITEADRSVSTLLLPREY